MPKVDYWKIFNTAAPYVAPIVSSILTSRAEGKAADITSKAGIRAAELQAQTAKESIDLARQIYNQDVGLNWPAYVTSTGALSKLARGTGIKTPEGLFNVPAKPPILGGFSPPGTALPESSTLSTALDLAPGPSGGKLKTAIDAFGGFLGGGLTGAAVGGSSALAGTALGAFGGPIGAAAGLGVGLAKNLIGRGRKEADQIVPYQNALNDEIERVGTWIKSKEAAGTLTPEDWATAYNTVKPLRDKFYNMTADFGRAGPGAQQTVTQLYDPTINNWGQNAGILPRKKGGPVMGYRPMKRGGFTPPGMYLVGEKGPEILEMTPGSEGYVYPNEMVDGMMGRKSGGPVRGQDKVHKVMSEFSQGTLRSSSGRKVTSRRQAIAIAMSEAGISRRQAGGSVGGPTYDELGNQTNPNYDINGNLIPGRGGVGEDIAGYQFGPGEVPQWATNLGVSQIGGRTFWPGVETPAAELEQIMPRNLLGQLPEGAGPWAEQYAMLDKLNAIGKPAPGIDTGIGSRASSGSPTGQAVQPVVSPGTVSPPGTTPVNTTPTTTAGIDKNIITQWGWSKNQYGQWVGPNGDIGHWTSGGQFINDTQNKIFDPATGQLKDFSSGGFTRPVNPYATMAAPYDTYEGEFLQPWQGQFGFDPEAAGFQPFNRPFEFNAEDLYKDPGYAFRVSEGQKGIERSAAAGGFLQSGRTVKGIERFRQGLAAQEYDAARNRALQEFGLAYGQTGDAYTRALGEYGQTRDEFLENQLRRRQWLQAMAGLGSATAGGA